MDGRFRLVAGTESKVGSGPIVHRLLFQLAVLRASPVDPATMNRTCISIFLAVDAQLDAWDGAPSGFGDRLLTLGAVGPALANGCTSQTHAFELVINRCLDLFVQVFQF